MEPICTCPLTVKHVGPHYSGRVLVHVEGCAWGAWYETIDQGAYQLAAGRRMAAALRYEAEIERMYDSIVYEGEGR